jgi:hypothetical protein
MRSQIETHAREGPKDLTWKGLDSDLKAGVLEGRVSAKPVAGGSIGLSID